MAVNKVIYGNKTLIDLTADTVTADKLAKGYTAHDKSGATITGTNTYDANTQDATAKVAEILIGKTAYVAGAKITGTMPYIGTAIEEIHTVNQQVAIPQGYHEGSGYVEIAIDEREKIIASNIKLGVEILGVTGTCEPSSDVTAHAKSVTPTTSAQTVIPDSGYDYLSQVTVAAIPYAETDNAAGGVTVTIAG